MRCSVIVLAVLASAASAGTKVSPRQVCDLNDGWSSTCAVEGTNRLVLAAENVSLPHVWGGYWGLRRRGHGNLHGTAVYRRAFVCPKVAGKRAFLVFDGAGMYLGVRVNGREICRHRPAGKVVTTVDVTDALSQTGTNALEVTCEHPSNITDMPWVCGACSDPHCEGPEATGLIRPVHLVVTDDVRIAPFGVFVWGKEPFAEVHVEVEVTNAGATAATRQVEVTCPAAAVEGRASVALEPGETKVAHLTLPMGAVKRWSAATPNLYTFTVALVERGVVRDCDRVETGFRTISWPFYRKTADRRFLVNGEPVFIHGVCETDHRFGSSLAFGPEEIDARARLIKDTLGFNAVRDGHEPHDLRWGRNWDRLGVYWWPQFGTHVYYDNDDFRRNYRALFREWMKERRNSPSVVFWGIQNESILELDFAKEMTAFVHRYDPSSSLLDRLATFCNYGEGSDWTVVQNWSGTYGGDLEKYGEELGTDTQLLNGEYGAWRHVGLHEKLPPKFDADGRWSEEHAAYILHRKLVQAWKCRDKVCGQFQWILFTHENPGRKGSVDESNRLIDKAGPVNNKGILTLWGTPSAAYYVYRAYGDALKKGTLDAIIDESLDGMIARGKALEAPRSNVPVISLRGDPARHYLYRLNCGGDACVDGAGSRWLADSTFFTRSWSQDAALSGDHLNPVLCSQGEIGEGVANASAADQPILSTYRWGRDQLSFTFAVEPLKRYQIEAWFAEPGGYGRRFDVAVNGERVETDLNLPVEAGNRVAVKRTWQARASAEGKLVVTFPRVTVSQAVVSALAVSESAASGFTPVVGAGYPATSNLTWKALASQVIDKVPLEDLPPFEAGARGAVLPIVAPQTRRRTTFVLPLSNRYTVEFKVKTCDRPHKDLGWELVASSDQRQIANGSLNLEPAQVGRFIPAEIKTFINAGVYQLTIDCPDGVQIEAAKMIETQGAGQ